jgi:hypothetical protein
LSVERAGLAFQQVYLNNNFQHLKAVVSGGGFYDPLVSLLVSIGINF